MGHNYKANHSIRVRNGKERDKFNSHHNARNIFERIIHQFQLLKCVIQKLKAPLLMPALIEISYFSLKKKTGFDKTHDS